MSKISEVLGNVAERLEISESAHNRWSINTMVAVSVSVTATLLALCNVKDGNIVQAMQQAQANVVDSWAYYQAKGTKLNIAEAALDGFEVQSASEALLTPKAKALLDAKIADYRKKQTHYQQEKEQIKGEAEAYKREYDALNMHDDQLDAAEAAMAVAISLFGIAALTQKRRLLYVAWSMAGVGVVFGLIGFLGLPFHPRLLAKLLG